MNLLESVSKSDDFTFMEDGHLFIGAFSNENGNERHVFLAKDEDFPVQFLKEIYNKAKAQLNAEPDSHITRWSCVNCDIISRPKPNFFGKKYLILANIKIAGKTYSASRSFVYYEQLPFEENLCDFRGYIRDIQQVLGQLAVRGHNKKYEVYIGRFPFFRGDKPTTDIC